MVFFEGKRSFGGFGVKPVCKEEKKPIVEDSKDSLMFSNLEEKKKVNSLNEVFLDEKILVAIKREQVFVDR